MRLFILTRTNFAEPKAVICQKVLDIIELGLSSPHIHFYIVGDHLPSYLEVLEQNNDSVTIIKEVAAEKLIREVTNAIVIHFGYNLKGSDHFPHYFIPVTHPSFLSQLSLWKKWRQVVSFKEYIKKSMATYAINEWSLSFLQKKYPLLSSSVQEAYLPITNVPIIEWVALADARNNLTDGCNYFLAFQPLDSFIDMLKEFSIFKKWQQTNMAIVFVFENEQATKAAKQLLLGYKFKEAVVVKSILEFKVEWVAATYAILWNDIDFSKSTLIESAIHYDIPLLFNKTVQKNSPMPASWQGAGEVFTFEEKGALSNHFKLYYKDEVYRQARARMGKEWLTAGLLEKRESPIVKIPLDLKSK